MSVVRKANPFVTLNCPVSTQFPHAGIARPTFQWSDMFQSPHVRVGSTTYDNTPTPPAASYINNKVSPPSAEHNPVVFQWPTSYPPTPADIKAANLIAKMVTGQYYPSTGSINVVDPPFSPGSVAPGEYIVITCGGANGPIPMADFEAADETLSMWKERKGLASSGHVAYEYRAK